MDTILLYKYRLPRTSTIFDTPCNSFAGYGRPSSIAAWGQRACWVLPRLTTYAGSGAGGSRPPWDRGAKRERGADIVVIMCECRTNETYWTNDFIVVTILKYIFYSSLLLSSSTRTRFHPQRSSGLAAVTGVVCSFSPSVRAFIFIAHRVVQHSHCSSTVIECCH